jgi:hypothetical protein
MLNQSIIYLAATPNTDAAHCAQDGVKISNKQHPPGTMTSRDDDR